LSRALARKKGDAGLKDKLYTERALEFAKLCNETLAFGDVFLVYPAHV
jgi:hypothetical protein